MNGTDKKTKTPVVISGYGKERYINGKESGPHTYTCPICGRLSNAIPILKLHAKEVHGKDIDIITFPMQDEEYSRLESHISPTP